MKKILFLLIFLLTACSSQVTTEVENIEDPVQKVEEHSVREITEGVSVQLEPLSEDNFLLDLQIKEMSLEEKIGQMFIVGFDGTKVDGNLKELISEYHVGGVIHFSRNIDSRDQLLELNNELKEISRINSVPMFLGVDEEGGRVSRLPFGNTEIPPNKEIGKQDNIELSYKLGSIIGNELDAFGFNLNFAPVLDIHSNPENTVIGDRSYGDNADLVSRMGVAAMQGIRDTGVVPVVKHFPGHGDTKVDSHVGLPIVNKTKEELYQLELKPFQSAIEKNVDMMMVAHIQYPNIDKEKKPATLSKEIITNLLREEMGYNGVVITDDMQMGAITENFGLEKATLESIKAGVDIVLICNDYEKEKKAIQVVREAVKSGDISEERINESVKRILLLKNKYNLSNDKRTKEDLRIVGSDLHTNYISSYFE